MGTKYSCSEIQGKLYLFFILENLCYKDFDFILEFDNDLSFEIAFYLWPFRFEKGGVGHHQEENLILHVSKCPIYILHCAKTFTIMVSCGGFIAKLAESRNIFCSLVLPKM